MISRISGFGFRGGSCGNARHFLFQNFVSKMRLWREKVQEKARSVSVTNWTLKRSVVEWTLLLPFSSLFLHLYLLLSRAGRWIAEKTLAGQVAVLFGGRCAGSGK